MPGLQLRVYPAALAAATIEVFERRSMQDLPEADMWPQLTKGAEWARADSAHQPTNDSVLG